MKSVTVVLFAVVVLASGFARAQEADGENVEMGRRLFYSYCALCHGVDGKGHGPLSTKLKTKRPPADLTQERFQKMSVTQLLEAIKGYSRGNSDMPTGWDKILPEKNLRAVAVYALRMSQRDLRLLGDTRRGREIFRQTCVACHGPSGEGNGVLTQLLNVKMANWPEKPVSKMPDDELIKVITSGRGQFMPIWAGPLSAEEIKDVAAYAKTLFKK